MISRSLLLRTLTGPVLVMAFMVGVFAVLMTGIQENLAAAEDVLRPGLDVVIFLQNSVSEADAKTWAETLMKQDPDLKSYSLTTRDQAYQAALKDPGLTKSLMLLKENPLPASLVLRYDDRALLQRSDLVATLKGGLRIQDLRWDPRALQIFRTLHQWRVWCMRFSLFIALILTAWVFVGLYRFLALQLAGVDFFLNLVLGLAGGAIAMVLWQWGTRTLGIEAATHPPTWAILLPLIFGACAAIGCLGLDIRDAE